ncbi:MAG: hypothetical protein KBA61_06245 [Spirochaetes bacterium]|jgi:ribosome-binding ATPase YchF (GTP1/OBG family)|nr:hypothetical protein [Spirochaetota bacterium]
MADKKKKKQSGKSVASKVKKTVRAKNKPVKKTEESRNAVVSRTKAKRPKKKTNLLRLCTEMNKVTIDAVDKEVTKRFRTLIDAADEDITKAGVQTILKNWKEVDLTQYHESLQPYIKHYIFMVKRKSGR